MMDYNEMDDYGTGWEEQAEAMWEQMIDAQVRSLRLARIATGEEGIPLSSSPPLTDYGL